MDDPSEWWWPTHDIWLKAGICMTQQLCNLDQLKGVEYLLVAVPLKIRDGTGCPVRAFAMVQQAAQAVSAPQTAARVSAA